MGLAPNTWIDPQHIKCTEILLYLLAANIHRAGKGWTRNNFRNHHFPLLSLIHVETGPQGQRNLTRLKDSH